MNQDGQGPRGSQGTSRIFDEFAKLMTDAAGVAQGARREVETAVKGQAERFLGHMDLVQRDEFEAVKEMASKARLENEALRKEIETLKEILAQSAPAKTKSAAAKSKKTTSTPRSKKTESAKKPSESENE